VDQILAEHPTPVPVEDLPLRFFCVSASLTRAEAVIHERGPLWPAVRASLALPGIYAPVYAAGDLLIDGAAVDNLPVDVMRHRVGADRIVAVGVSSEVEPLTVAPAGRARPAGACWGAASTRSPRPHPVPGIAEILNRSTGLSQVRHRRVALGDDRADLLLCPPVARLRSLDFKGGIALPVRGRGAGQVRPRQTVRDLSHGPRG
jgi:NTE family protein